MQPTRRPVPWVAMLLSLLDPGLGHVYAGQRRGLAYLGGFIALILAATHLIARGFAGLLVAMSLVVGGGVVLAVLALQRARRIGELHLTWLSRWPALVSMAVVSGVISNGVRSISPVRAFRLPSRAMEPTLLDGDYFFADQRPASRRPVLPGDIVVFKSPMEGRDFVKRCVAVAGQNVELRDKQLWVDGVAAEEPFVGHVDPKILTADASPRDSFGPMIIPAGHVFILGDNRDNSLDSRFWGPLPLANVKGHALYLYLSWDSERKRMRMERLGRRVQ